MQAVDVDVGFVDELRESRIRIEADAVDQRRAGASVGIGMLDRRDSLVAGVLVETATKGDVQQLLTATDAERGEVIGKRPARQRQLGAIPRRLVYCAGFDL